MLNTGGGKNDPVPVRKIEGFLPDIRRYGISSEGEKCGALKPWQPPRPLKRCGERIFCVLANGISRFGFRELSKLFLTCPRGRFSMEDDTDTGEMLSYLPAGTFLVTITSLPRPSTLLTTTSPMRTGAASV